MDNQAYFQTKGDVKVSKTANINELLKKNREREKKEKIFKFYALLVSCFGLIIASGIYIYL